MQAFTAKRDFEARVEASHTLSAAFNAIVEQRRHDQNVALVIRCQALVRGKIDRRRYMKTRASIIHLQAKARGNKVRRHQAICMDEALSSSREQLVELWHELNVSLLTRSQFWVVFAERSYLSLFVHLEEVQRLRQQRDELRSQSHAPQIDEPSIAVKVERERLYQSLRRKISSKDREAMFSRSNIFGKKRKRRLSAWLWSENANYDRSAEIVLRIFGGDDGGKMAQYKQRRIRKSMHGTTECSLNAIMRLCERVKHLKAEMRDIAEGERRALKQVKLLSWKLSLHQSATNIGTSVQKSLASKAPVHGYRPHFAPE